METPVYNEDRLLPGNEILGPAILESEYTTVVIPPQVMYRVDAYGLGIMSSTSQPSRLAGSAAIAGAEAL